MKTHIMIAVIALVVTACSSKRDIANTQESTQNNESSQHAQIIDGQASRIR